ncbi:hypothetical protein I203_102880 [Kwoniella mangroviensis CBS 8507]|uniref:uncharacterized protein n=1 Tax=Kwoniella mangroviensis CBS 8507 TaxID=1296122 RepID=UPI00080D3FEA|nr:uncharacterized protein I203_03854 [Kwoniella mangroviensis CBS 8507]OCF67168.1 hypothetical protein I203_03854 [Kwoniella mangroviensis CBS 8507]
MPFVSAQHAMQNDDVDLELIPQSAGDSLQPRPNTYSTTLPTHRISLFKPSDRPVELPTDRTVIAFDDCQTLRDSFRVDLKVAISPWFLHSNAIRKEDEKIDEEMLTTSREIWDRPTNHKASKSVTENSLEAVHGLQYYLEHFFGICNSVYRNPPNSESDKEVTFDLIANHRFSLSSLSEDVKVRLVKDDVFSKFRSIGFTLRSAVPAITNDAPEFEYKTSRIGHQFEISWDIESDRTKVRSLYVAKTSKDDLRKALGVERSQVSGVSSVDTLADDLNWVEQAIETHQEQEEYQRERERRSTMADFVASIQEVGEPDSPGTIDARRAIIAQAESEYRRVRYGWFD